MIEFIWDPLIVTSAMLLCSAIGYVLLVTARRITRPKPNPEKTGTYSCGEVLKPDELHPDSAGFFSPVKKVIRPFYNRVGSAHTGELSRYILWAVCGLLAIFFILLLMEVLGWL
ncbi:MAG: hypothetical protein QXG10_03410 [Candidatus Hadarchaeales archaeon]